MTRRVFVLVLIIPVLITACGSDDESGGSVPEGPIDVTTLREQAASLDGETVTVRSTYWSNGETQYLSDILMESYPPQIPTDQAIILLGEMPAEVLATLDQADPSFAQITWGEVEITGVVHAGEQVELEIVEARSTES